VKTKHGFTLMELLIVVAVTTTVIALTGQLFVEGWTISHGAIRRINDNQMIPIIMKTWQKALRHSPPSSWKIAEESFHAGTTIVKQTGKHLVVITDGKEKHILLPQDSTCKFTIEQTPDMTKCAVMDFNWASHYYRNKKMNHVRFVSCGSNNEKAE